MNNGIEGEPDAISIVIRRVINAAPDRIFRAWTEQGELVAWWGPVGVVCESAEIDLRIGGCYSINNRLDDGRLIVISGVFDLIDPPHQLAYSWQIGSGNSETSRVTVDFCAIGDQETEVVVTHSRISDSIVAADHHRGWNGCLDGLSDYFANRSV